MLLDLRGRGHWYALSASGALWWWHLARGATVSGAADRVAEYYGADPGEVRADMAALARQLRAHGLLRARRTKRRKP
jgi:hypothetical protein